MSSSALKVVPKGVLVQHNVMLFPDGTAREIALLKVHVMKVQSLSRPLRMSQVPLLLPDTDPVT
jgi:hypothetical protein